MTENEMFTPWPEPTRAKVNAVYDTEDYGTLLIRDMPFGLVVATFNSIFTGTTSNREVCNEYAWRIWKMAFSDANPLDDDDMFAKMKRWPHSEELLYTELRGLCLRKVSHGYTRWVIASFRLKRFEYIEKQKIKDPLSQAALALFPKEAPKELDPLDSSSVRFSLLELF